MEESVAPAVQAESGKSSKLGYFICGAVILILVIALVLVMAQNNQKQAQLEKQLANQSAQIQQLSKALDECVNPYNEFTLPESTVLSPPLYANNWMIKSSGITLELKNNGGDDLTLGDVVISNCGSVNSGASLPANGMVIVTVPCSQALTVGYAFKGDVAVNYQKTGSTLSSQSTGTVAGKIVS